MSGTRISLSTLGISLLLLLVAAGAAEARYVWTAELGWRRVDRKIDSTPAELLAESDKAFAAKAWKDAVIGYERVVRRHPVSPQAKKAWLGLYESQYRAEDFVSSLDTINRLLKTNPDAETTAKLVRRKYDIGSRYLGGAPHFVFGIPISGKGKGVKILQEVADRHPFLPFSDDALFYIAGNFFDLEKFEQAEAVYQRLIRVYPQSEWAGIAEYQIGECALRRHKGVPYDSTLVDQAERSFRRYLQRFPRGGKREDAKKQLVRIDEMRAAKLLLIAQHYIRSKRPKAARFYLQRVLKDHPDAPAAESARRLLTSPGAQDAK